MALSFSFSLSNHDRLPDMGDIDAELTPEILERFREHLKPYFIEERQVTLLPSQGDRQGGFAVVERGVLRATEEPNAPEVNVAVKILKTKNLGAELYIERRLLREAYIWSRMNHGNVTEFKGYRFGTDEPNSITAWLLSPWAVNGTIKNHVQAKSLSPLERLRLVHGATAGLNYLHSLQPAICHGDLKPENVLINGTPEALLTDFGLSAILDDAELAPLHSESLVTAGSLRYMSPEMLDEIPRMPPSDVWSLGWLIWETLTGQIPFKELGNRKMQIMKSIACGKLPDPHGVDEISVINGLPDLVQRCWDMEPDERPTSHQVSTELQAIVSQIPAPAS